ncbi:RidA family protein [Nitrosomonas sp.]|uniref:RidA family protein n=1 Tax=Nitrosomonas sp. TaxID=42353 RepID=UPI0025F2F048|nr:RidA family protein [Nitrosomonas sp.]
MRWFKTRFTIKALRHYRDILRKTFSIRQKGHSMARKLISSGSTFEKEIGYSRAVVEGDWVLVSGTTGFDYSKMTISNDLLEQAEQCFQNIESALQQAGASMKDVVRVTYVFPKAEDFEKCWPVMRKYLGNVRPSAMMLAAGLSDPRMKIEIQVTAYRNTGAE